MITSSSSPEGPYSKPVWIHEDGIDPSIFHDDDGKKYMLLNRGARIFELDKECKKKIGQSKLLWVGVCRRSPEGPHILKKDGYYYLFLAEGGTGMGHMVNCARSKELFGIYEPCPYNPIVRQEDEKQLLQCCVHGMPIEGINGEWYMSYLTLRRSKDGYGFTGRESCIDKITWISDGWPLVNKGNGPAVFSETPKSGDSIKTFSIDLYYPNWEERLWTTPRPLDKNMVKQKNNSLFLTGSGMDLCFKECRSIFLERQKEFDFDAECILSTTSIKEGESAGIASYYDENSYIKFGISVKDGKTGVLLALYVDDRYEVLSFTPLEVVADSVVLKEKCRGKNRTFSCCGYEETIEALCLASEGLRKGKRFTGAMVGIYVEGKSTVEFLSWNSDFYREDLF